MNPSKLSNTAQLPIKSMARECNEAKHTTKHGRAYIVTLLICENLKLQRFKGNSYKHGLSTPQAWVYTISFPAG